VAGSPWEVSDELWAVIEPLLPAHPRRLAAVVIPTPRGHMLPKRCPLDASGGPEGRPRRERFRATMRFAGMGDARLELATPSLSSWFGADDARQQSTPNACKRGACRLPQGDCLAWFRNPISGRLCRECAARSLVLTVRARTRLARRPP
jgi:hypothetical protein